MKYRSSFLNSGNFSKGFSLIELLVVISIIGILMGLSIFGLQGAREASRDSKRKADLEQIRSALEIYKADCDKYPIGSGNPSVALDTGGGQLGGDGSTSSCPVTNAYMTHIPTDPTSPNGAYLYYSDGNVYQICANLENGTGVVTCGTVSSCGTGSCNYQVKNP